jgi:hypothetical protein
MKELRRPIPAHGMMRSAPASANTYIVNTVEPRNPAGPHWFNKLLSLIHLELVKK